jgi:hypothetical protein
LWTETTEAHALVSGAETAALSSSVFTVR